MPRTRSRRPRAGDGEGSRFIHEERAHRLAKLDALRERGIEPYPVRFDRDHTAAELRERFADLGPGADTGERVSVAGRRHALRRHGGLDFADLRDETGEDPAVRDPRRARRGRASTTSTRSTSATGSASRAP